MWFFIFFFFFKQKTAYEMRISDWSSDVCSSDLEESYRRAEAAQVHLLEYSLAVHLAREPQRLVAKLPGTPPTRAKRLPEVARIGRHLRLLARAGLQLRRHVLDAALERLAGQRVDKIGQATCRERVCPDV